MSNPVVLIPGIKGTELADTCPITHHISWSFPNMFLTDVYDLELDPTGQVDRCSGVIHKPWQIFSIVYKPLYDYLRGKLDVPVYVFAYDWRLSNKTNGARLLDFLDDLRKKPDIASHKQFDVVCHSMGGLVLRAGLKEHQRRSPSSILPVRRAAFIATPHLGSLDSVDGMIRGESLLLHSKVEMRKIARTMPAVYDLLPRFSGAVTAKGQPLDIYDLDSWQENIVTGKERYRLSADHLASAKNLHLNELIELGDLGASNVLNIYGDEANSTLVHIPVVAKPSQNLQRWYDFDHADRDHGDGVVPVNSAAVPGFPAVRMLKSDLRWYELRDHAFVRAVSFHGFLPVMNEVHAVVARFLEGATGQDRLPRSLPPARFTSSF